MISLLVIINKIRELKNIKKEKLNEYYDNEDWIN